MGWLQDLHRAGQRRLSSPPAKQLHPGKWVKFRVDRKNLPHGAAAEPIEKQRCTVVLESREMETWYSARMSLWINGELCRNWPIGKGFNVWIEDA